jgi:hypothetical protein
MSGGRDIALDMVKGLMVVGMLLFHTAAMMPSGHAIVNWLYVYPLGFISGSWIFIAGFLVTHLNRERFAVAAGEVTRRTCMRGLRLVAIFAIANILLGKLTFNCAAGMAAGDCAWWAVFVRGANGGMTYEIIQAIGYVLIVGPLFLLVPTAAMALTGAALAAATIGALAGHHLKGLYFAVLIGAVGLCAGFLLPRDGLPRILSEVKLRRTVTGIALLGWVSYQSAMYFSDVPMRGGPQSNAGVYLVGVVSSLVLLYLISGAVSWRGAVGWCMRLMAAYSLLCYLVQMIILKGWYVLVGDAPLLGSYGVSLVAAFALMIGGVALLDRARRRIAWVDRSYHLVFG